MGRRKKIILTGASGVVGRGVFIGLSSSLEVIKIGKSPASDLNIDLARRGIDITREVPCPDYVIHLAAVVPGNNNISDDNASAEDTMAIDNNIFNACELWQCPVIYTSGCSLYEPKDTGFLLETSPFRDKFSSPYLRAKEIGDRKFRSLKRGSVLRISFPVGSGLSSANVLGNFLNQIKVSKKINVFGSGTREQDFVDVRDIAAMMRLIIENELEGVFNVASGHPTSMRALAELIVSLKGFGNVSIGIQEDPLDRTLARYSVRKAFEKMVWKPQFDLRETLCDHGICKK